MFPGLQAACASLSTACQVSLTHLGAWVGGCLRTDFHLHSRHVSPLQNTASWRAFVNRKGYHLLIEKGTTLGTPPEFCWSKRVPFVGRKGYHPSSRRRVPPHRNKGCGKPAILSCWISACPGNMGSFSALESRQGFSIARRSLWETALLLLSIASSSQGSRGQESFYQDQQFSTGGPCKTVPVRVAARYHAELPLHSSVASCCIRWRNLYDSPRNSRM